MRFPGGVGARVVLRSLLVQGSWNYETLIGTGFAFTVLPALRHLHRDDPDALRAALARHAEVFNSNPYLATVAAGAVASLEAEHKDPRLVERFKSALRGSLGSLGDQLMWTGWRPATVLLALTLALAGVVWWGVVLAFLLCYNVLNLWLRVWGWRIGTERGIEVGRALRDAPLLRLAGRSADAGALLGGFALVLALAPARSHFVEAGLTAAAVGVGFWLGAAARRVFMSVIALVWLIALAWGWIG